MADVQLPDKINLNDIKPNSHKYRKEVEAEANSEEELNDQSLQKKELTGDVTEKKRSFLKRCINIFFKDGASPKEIKEYLIEEVIVPAILENIADAINVAVEMRFFGAAKRRKPSKGSSNGSKINYGSFYNGGETKRERIANSIKERSERDSINDYIFDSREDVEKVLVDMRELLDRFDQVTVADYYDILRSYGISVKSNHTDNKFGWTDLGNVEPIRARGGGYYLDLPREKAL